MQPSREAILACNPTLVIAVSGISGTSLQWLQKARVPLLTVSTNSLKDVYQSILQIGAVVNRRTLALHIARQMRGEIEAVNSVTTSLKAVRVLPLYQVSPIYTSTRSSFIANEIAAAGGTSMTAGVGEDGTTTSENVLQYQPQVILCDTRILKAIKLMPGWQTSVPAVRTNRYYWLNRDGEALVRPTPRIALAVEHLALFLHPHHAPAVSRAFLLAQRTFASDKSGKKREAQ
jgi:ABC-type Fe3+-hydroxamate transport system substrate-binding protein